MTAPPHPMAANTSHRPAARIASSAPSGRSPNITTAGRIGPARPQRGQDMAENGPGGASHDHPRPGHRARSSDPCRWWQSSDPALSCRLSTFVVTSRNGPGHRLPSSANARWAAFGPAAAHAARLAS